MSDQPTDPLQTTAAIAAQEHAQALQSKAHAMDADTLDLLFREARSHNGWQAIPVPDSTLKALYDIVRWGATSMNCCPARFVFVRSDEGKQRLEPALAEANRAKVLSAPVTVIIAYDLAFYERLPELFPHRDVAPMFRNNPPLAQTTAFRNGTLQGAYLMLAARALGLDCGPMSGFDNQIIDDAFFSGTGNRSNFLCSLGYGNTSKLFQRLPRLDFDSACELV